MNVENALQQKLEIEEPNEMIVIVQSRIYLHMDKRNIININHGLEME